MDTYSLLREFADSWMLLTLFVFFVGVLIWAFRPGSRSTHQVAATAIFRHETSPAEVAPANLTPTGPGRRAAR